MKRYITILIVATIVLLSAFVAGCSSTTKPSPSSTPIASTTATKPTKAIATSTPTYIPTLTPTYAPTYTPANSIPTVAPVVIQTPSIIVQ